MRKNRNGGTGYVDLYFYAQWMRFEDMLEWLTPDGGSHHARYSPLLCVFVALYSNQRPLPAPETQAAESSMAGHSKWKQIKHYKAATDAKRGALFTKLIREITMAAKLGGGDPAGNPRLRAGDRRRARPSRCRRRTSSARSRRARASSRASTIQEVTYEGYGPGGVALIIDAVTDNPTRTVADVRHKMSRGGGNLGTPNSVAFMFEKKGQIYARRDAALDEDALLEAALDAGAEDFRREDERVRRHDRPGDVPRRARARSRRKGIVVAEAELAMVPKNTVQVAGEDVESLFKLIETLEDLDDVQKVWAQLRHRRRGAREGRG